MGNNLSIAMTWKVCGLLLGRKVALRSMHVCQSLVLTLLEAGLNWFLRDRSVCWTYSLVSSLSGSVFMMKS